MRNQQRFNTEMKEPFPAHTPGYHKPSQHSMYSPGFFKKPSLPSFKNLTVRIIEAKLLNDVSVFGKMHTFTKIKIGEFIWQTSIDKDSHMNPKWNESKIFDVSSLCKSIKELENQIENSAPKDNLTHRKWNSSQGVGMISSHEEPKIEVTVYHKGFLQSAEIGHVKINLKDLMKAKATSDWFILLNKQDIVGSILVSFEFQNSEEDILTMINKAPFHPKVAMESESRNESRHGSAYKVVPKDSSRMPTEAGRPTKSPIFEKKRIFNGSGSGSAISGGSHVQSYNSTYHTKRHESSVPRFYSGHHQSYQSTDYDNMMRPSYQGQSQQGPKKGSRDFSRGATRSNIPKASKPAEEREIDVANTLITYEYHHEDDNALGDKQQSYECFFNTRSFSDERDSQSSDVTDCDIKSEQADEGARQMDTHDDYSPEMPEVPRNEGEMRKVLQELKKDNINIMNKEVELKDKFASMREEFDKLSREKEHIQSREQALIMRENCIRNERKNLAVEFNNMKMEQEKIRSCFSEIHQLEHELEEARQEEDMQKAQTIELENKVKEMSLYVQRETQSLKHFEQDMYKSLIAKKVMTLQNDEQQARIKAQKSRKPSLSQQHDNKLAEEHTAVNVLEDVSNLNRMLTHLKQASGSLNQELEAKSQSIGKIKEMLKEYNKENIMNVKPVAYGKRIKTPKTPIHH